MTAPLLNLDDFGLTARSRLPDALRVLLEEFPREGWEAHPGFDGLIRFWLERHMMFRQLLETLRTEAEQAMDAKMDPQRFAAGLSRYGGFFVNQLHTHHMIEDQHYFPVLSSRDGRVSQGFEILDRDHHALDGLLNGFVEAANGAIGGLEGKPVPDAVAPYRETLIRLDGLIGRHLEDEEDLVVPVILKHGSAGLS